MNNIKNILIEAGAWHEGHTLFRNGFHGNGWIDKNTVESNPKYLDQIAKLQAEEIKSEFPEVDLLMGPITGGALIASYVARHLGLEFGIIQGKQEPILFHPMNVPTPEEKVVLVEDIISSGVDMGIFTRFLKQNGVNVIGISVWMNRRENEMENVKVIDLLDTPFELYEKEKCPHCLNNTEVKFSDIRE